MPRRLLLLCAAALLSGGCGTAGSSPPPGAADLLQVADGPPAAAPVAHGLAPLPARTPQPGPAVRTRVPVLMYHVVSQAPPGTAYSELWVSSAHFAAQVRALRAAGYEAVTLQEVWDAWRGRDRLPPKPVVLSFGDGDASRYAHAAKILRPLGWPGVLFLQLGDVGPGGLTAREVRAMHAAGWELDRDAEPRIRVDADEDAAAVLAAVRGAPSVPAQDAGE